MASQPIVQTELPPPNLSDEPANPFPNNELASNDPAGDETPATPVRTQVAALAASSQTPASTDNAAMRALKDAVAKSSELLNQNQERALRFQSAGRQITEEGKNLDAAFRSMPQNLVSPETQQAARASLVQHYNQDLERRTKTALEDEAFHQMRELSAAGRTTEARMMLRQYDEDSGNTLKVIQSHAVKRMLISQAAERAEAAQKGEGWAHWLLSGAISIPETLLMGNSFSLLGNVPKGTQGYAPHWFQLLRPGSEFQRQVDAFKRMSAADAATFMPTLIDNIRSNATTLGVFDPGRAANLTRGFSEGYTSEQATESNLWALADAAGLFPFGTATKMAKAPFMISSAGGRRLAEKAVHSAVDEIIANGSEAAAASTGIDAAEAESHVLPSAINPHIVNDQPHVSLSGDVNDSIRTQEETLRQLHLSDTSRFTSQEEVDQAAESTVNDLRARLGDAVKDHTVEKVDLPDGTFTYRVNAIIGHPEGGGHATEAELRGFLEGHGYETSPDSLISSGVETERTLSHAEEGFTIPAFHGSKSDFENFDSAHLGKTTSAGSAKIAHFFASPKGAFAGEALESPEHAANIAWSYARMAQEDVPTLKAYNEANASTEEISKKLARRHDELSDDITKEFSEEGVYVNNTLKLGFDEGKFLAEHPQYTRVIDDISDEFSDRILSRIENDNVYQQLKQESVSLFDEADRAWKAHQASTEIGFDAHLSAEGKKLKAEIEALNTERTDIYNHPDVVADNENAQVQWDRLKELGKRKEELQDRLTVDEFYGTFKKGSPMDNAIEAKVDAMYPEKDKFPSAEKDANNLRNSLRRGAVDEHSNGWWEMGDEYRNGLTMEDYRASAVDGLFTKTNRGGVVYPVRVKGNNLKVVEGNRSKYADTVYRDELEKAREEGFDGVIFKDARDPGHIDPSLPEPPDESYDVIALFDPKDVRMALSKGTVIKDSSQQYFGRVSVDIKETGFYTAPLNPPRQSFVSKFWKTTSQTMDQRLFEQATRSGQKRNRLYKIIQNQLTKIFRSLNKDERTWLNQILAEGDKRSMWFNEEQFNVLYERATGSVPTPKVQEAYKQFRKNNDLEYVLRNSDVYRQKIARGFKSARFNTFGDAQDVDVLELSMAKAPRARVYNLTDDVHYTNSDIYGEASHLTNERVKNLEAQGYVLVRTEQPLVLKDGTTIDHFIAKRDDILTRPLRYEQLPYKAGGHRLYADKYFVKQASWGVQPDTGKRFLKNPNVHITAPTIKNARDWADTMNAAREAIKEGQTAEFLDETIFRGRPNFPKGEDFMADMEAGRIDMDEPFEAVFDREMPAAYNKNVDVDRFIDDEEIGFNGYYRTTGKMYYSPKGTALKDYTGEWAPTIDPFAAQSRALENVSKMSSFSDFKTSAIDRWVSNYRNQLNIRELPEEMAASPAHVFNSATVSRSTPVSLRQQIEGQREAIKRILGFESEFDRGLRNFTRATAEWVVGDSDSAVRQGLSKGVYWLQDKSPIGFLRGLAFDMKLGLLNPGQLLLQSSTMASALALSPRLGARGIASVPFVRAYFLASRNGLKAGEDVLETLVKRGAAKAAGFEDVAEFKEYARSAARSGFFDMSDTHALVNNIGPANTFGSITGGIEGAREMGRMFFYEAEVWNRLTAWRIAYGEAIERFGKEKVGHFEFNNFLSGRAENYAFNMSNESKAHWQTGLLSIPTQFWAYNVRMIEALTGKNFTVPQKLRLAGMQLGIAGTAGLPILAGLEQAIQEHYGVKPKIDTIMGTASRGFIDRGIYEMFGADVELSQRWGTGSWSSDLVKDVFGLSEYHEKPLAEMAGGATYSILGTALGSAVRAAHLWSAQESGAEDVNLSEDDALALFKQVSTFNNAMKGYMVYNYGVYQSAKGSNLISGLPSVDAAFIAMGLPPAELDEIGSMMAHQNARKEDIQEAATQINNLLQEGIAIPSRYELNARKVGLLMKMIPPDMRKEVLRKAHHSRDPSLYSSLIRQREQQEKQGAVQ